MLSTLYSDLMLWPASDTTCRILAYSKFYLFRYIQAYSSIFSIIKAYSCILTHSEGLFRLIQASSSPSVNLTYSQPCHIPSLAYLELESYWKPCETLDRHIQNPAIVTAWKKVHIQSFSGPNMGKYRPKETAYLDTFHIVSQSNLFRHYSAIFRPGVNISFLSRVKFSGRNEVTLDDVNFRPEIRKKLFLKKYLDIKSFCDKYQS